MKTTRHPRELTDAEAEALVEEFDAGSDYVTGADALVELRSIPSVTGSRPRPRTYWATWLCGSVPDELNVVVLGNYGMTDSVEPL